MTSVKSKKIILFFLRLLKPNNALLSIWSDVGNMDWVAVCGETDNSRRPSSVKWYWVARCVQISDKTADVLWLTQLKSSDLYCFEKKWQKTEAIKIKSIIVTGLSVNPVVKNGNIYWKLSTPDDWIKNIANKDYSTLPNHLRDKLNIQERSMRHTNLSLYIPIEAQAKTLFDIVVKNKK